MSGEPTPAHGVPQPPGRGALPILRSLSLGLHIGISVVAPLLLFVLGGRLLDRAFGATPLFLLLGLVLSAVLSVVLIVHAVRAVVRGASQ